MAHSHTHCQNPDHSHHSHDFSGPVVDVKDMDFYYTLDKPVLKNIDLQINHGENICIIGPNGGGKTTFIKLLLGFLRPRKGAIQIFNAPAHHVCDHIGYVPQHVKLNSSFPITVKEVVLMGCHLHSMFSRHKKLCYDQAQEAMDFMCIGDLAKHQFSELSGGQRQRVLIARAIASHPRLLLLDEPTANVDPKSADDFRELINKLKGETTLITVSHDIAYMTGDVDRAFLVNKGLHELTKDELASDQLMHLYRGH